MMKIKKQEDIKDCGIVVLQSVFHFFNKYWLSISELKRDAFYNEDGIVIKNLQSLALKWGIELEAFYGDIIALKEINIQNPIITIIKENDLNHYVIIKKIDKKYIYILDPISGLRKLEIEYFKKIFSNILITTKKVFDINLKKIENKSPFLHFIWKPEIIWLIILILITSILGFATSFFLKNVINKAILFKNIDVLIKITIVFTWIILFKFFQNIIKELYIKQLQNKIELKVLQNFIFALKEGQNSQLLKLEVSDYIKRFNLISNFSSFIAKVIFVFFSELLTFILSSVILFVLNWKIFLICLLFSSITFSMSFWYRKHLSQKYENLLKIANDLNSNFYNISKNLENLKNKDAFKLLNKLTLESYNNLKQEDIKLWTKNFIFKNFHSFASELLPIFIIFFSAFLVIKDKFELGDMILFISFFSSFINPINSLLDLVIYYPIFSNEYDLLKFILFIPKEKNGDKNINKIETILIENLDHKPNNIKSILKIDKLKINKDLIIKGTNGSGKSTLLKVINQTIETDPNIKINNLSIDFINKEVLREKIIYLSPDKNMFKSDVFTFITFANPEKVDTFLENIIKFNLENLLEKWNIDLKTIIKDNWSNFSDGQRQIIFLLRLLCKKYDVILLDEAFENISQENFDIIKKMILNFQNQAIFIEVSHSGKYIKESEILELDKK